MNRRRLLVAVAIAATVPALAACGNDGPPPRDRADVLMERCLDLGGAYYEYEATSAGAHVWCVTADGAEISMDGSE